MCKNESASLQRTCQNPAEIYDAAVWMFGLESKEEFGHQRQTQISLDTNQIWSIWGGNIGASAENHK